MSGEKSKLICIIWPPDDIPRGRAVQVKIDNDEPVAALREMIKLKYAPRFDNVSAPDLVLWKCSGLPDDNLGQTLKIIQFDGSDARVVLLDDALQQISQIFGNKDLSKEPINILVQVPELGECGIHISNSATEAWILLAANQGPPDSSADLRKLRQQFSAELPVTAPSSPSQFYQFQEKAKEQRIMWSRPPAADATIPVTLLHPIFHQFLDNCKNLRPTQETNTLVRKLMGAMSGFFKDERARAAELRGILMGHGIPVMTSTISSKGHDFPTDGAVEIDGHLVAIVEVQEEIGSKGAEPYAQVILYYSHSSAAKSREFPKFNFPSLLITVFGPQISFSGAVWTTQPHFQVLTPTLPLFCHSTDTDMCESLARHFGAFKAAIQSLEQCYNLLKTPTLLENMDA